MKDVKIGICKEPGAFRAYCGTESGNIASVKAVSRGDALVQLFDILSYGYVDYFYDGDITLDE